MHDLFKVGDLVELAASKHPHKEALINEDSTIRYTYEEFNKYVNSAAKVLLKLGVQKGEKVTIWSKNSPEWIISQIAISRTGAVMVPFNSHEKELMISRLLKYSDTSVLIMMEGVHDKENIEMLYEICPGLCKSDPENLDLRDYPSLKNVIVISEQTYPGTLSWNNIINEGEEYSDDDLKQRIAEVSLDDPTHMIYTSGTTGRPKGVLLTHKNIISDVSGLSQRLGLTPDDRMCIQPPLFHTFGSIACSILSIYNGLTMVIMDKYRPDLTLRQIEREKCTIASGVPTMFVGFYKEFQKRKYDISTLRGGIIAGSTAPRGLISDVIEKMNIKGLIQSYGMTETSPAITANNHDDSVWLKSETAGYPLPGVEIKIIDEITGADLPEGKEGEICVRGDNIMKGYYKQPEETARVIDEEGWLHTGDVGLLRENGYLTIRSRIKDIIIRSGENIYPGEIEDYIATHEEIEDIYVVGVQDNVYGEEIIAFIKLKDGSTLTEDEIKQYCRGKLASNKIPKYIIFVEQYPVTDTGKVSKLKLKDLASKIV